ncbi:hypothetical protein ACHHYP_10798 [Achlya hypogyna]|uniref:Disease resistance R13L4/SHOC-2-like LRR domain-containing protein n=1 Tax=Achlya hypogyna TaxID=1202772 RepID=A0A1V9YKM0_ACHHY|nr:hypothetical protein ACHHYP_10798 [Achlya hypogyna]
MDDPTTEANVFPFDELCGDSILYRRPDEVAAAHQAAGLKEPVVNIHKEYSATASYAKARETIHTIVANHKAKVLSNNERYIRDQKAEQFKIRFLETRLATTGPPTLNTMAVMIERRRVHAQSTMQNESNPVVVATEKQRGIKTAMCRSYGSGKLDLKALHIDVVPDAIFSTFLLQMARFIKEINISRNEFRELSAGFCAAFPGCETLNATENSIMKVSPAIGDWVELHTLTLDCNKLDTLPDALPPSLVHMSVARNRLVALPAVHRLTRLVTLDLSHNLLTQLPNALQELTLLRSLACAKNHLLSMALLPAPAHPRRRSVRFDETSHDASAPHEWSVSDDPETKASVYFNNKSKQVTRQRPAVLGPDPTTIPLLRLHPPRPEATTSEFSGGWEIVPGARTNYKNHLTGALHTSVPPELDRYDRLVHMKKLNLSGNAIDELPASVGRMHSLETLNVGHNRLSTLPASLCELTKLVHLLAPANCISSLPQGLVSFAALRELDLKLNRLEELPPEVGKLHTLTALDLSSNHLQRVPGSFLQLRRLTTLRLSGNPSLRVPSAAAQTAGLAAIFAEIQNQIYTDARGEPPLPQQLQTGIFDECITTDIHVHRELMELIAAAKTTRCVDFHWRNLKALPQQLFELDKLLELRLTGHDLGRVPPEVALLPQLRLLTLRQNRIAVMDAACVASACAWEELDLENNELSALPESLGLATRLRVLRAGCNRLEALPTTLGTLSQLHTCLVPHNHLTVVPDTVAHLAALQVLDVSNNRIASLSSFDFAACVSLFEFKANRNLLTTLPATIARSNIRDLALYVGAEAAALSSLRSGNLFDIFPVAACGMQHIRRLWMQSNRLLELPIEFGELRTLEMVEFEGNPLRSPPPSILAQGIVDVHVYLQKRLGRVHELQALLAAAPYGFHADHFVPRTRELLTSNIEFLLPEDLRAFERAVDGYVNGAFFDDLDTRGVDLVHRLQAKQYDRAQAARKAVLDDVINLCHLIQAKRCVPRCLKRSDATCRWLDKVDFRYDLTRPWGYAAEDTPCFMLNPKALYDDWEDVPSLLHVIEKRVGRGFKEEKFCHAPDVVADALNNYKGVYGPVGLAHDRVPFRCGCEDMLRKGTRHDPCYKFGWVIVHTLVTHEEAGRRVKEDAQIDAALAQVRSEVHTFLTTTRDGKARLFKEAKKLKVERKQRKKRIKKQLPQLKKAIILRKADLNVAKQKAALDKTVAGDAWTDSDEKLAQATLRGIEEDVAQQEEHVADMAKMMQELKRELRQDFNHYVTEIVDLLLGTTGKEIRERIIHNQRIKAVRKQYRRPWDLEFERFKAKYLDMPPPPSPRDNSEISDVSDQDYDNYEGSESDSVSSVSEVGDDPADKDEELPGNEKADQGGSKEDAAADPDDSDDSDI